ncbi:MAG: hypothetical protein SFU25_10505 [Candidatus Caenarcaniphilales bacterium]|nr:hypothetical protein [Candidatus Caenarcaniphilales bacterium]
MTNKNIKREGGGSKLNRSEVISIRLDPKLSYLCEIAARSQRRTKSSFIEKAIEDTLHKEQISNNETSLTVSNCADLLWDVEEADRVCKLAVNFYNLLSYEEQRIWKFLRKNACYWLESPDETILEDNKLYWPINKKYLNLSEIRANWNFLKDWAEGYCQSMDDISVSLGNKSESHLYRIDDLLNFLKDKGCISREIYAEEIIKNVDDRYETFEGIKKYTSKITITNKTNLFFALQEFKPNYK